MIEPEDREVAGLLAGRASPGAAHPGAVDPDGAAPGAAQADAVTVSALHARLVEAAPYFVGRFLDFVKAGLATEGVTTS